MSVKVIIAGGRDFDDYTYMCDVVEQLFYNHHTDKWMDIEVVSGGAKGADQLGEKVAASHSFNLSPFPADWEYYGKKAGIYRNHEMADYANVLVAFWDGESKGTKNMIEVALTRGLEVHVYRY